MLVITRKMTEKLIIGNEIEIQVLRIGPNAVRLGIKAPAHIAVHRQEIFETIKQENPDVARSQILDPELVKMLTQPLPAPGDAELVSAQELAQIANALESYLASEGARDREREDTEPRVDPPLELLQLFESLKTRRGQCVTTEQLLDYGALDASAQRKHPIHAHALFCSTCQLLLKYASAPDNWKQRLRQLLAVPDRKS
jgi:carbon storage regulator